MCVWLKLYSHWSTFSGELSSIFLPWRRREIGSYLTASLESPSLYNGITVAVRYSSGHPLELLTATHTAVSISERKFICLVRFQLLLKQIKFQKGSDSQSCAGPISSKE